VLSYWKDTSSKRSPKSQPYASTTSSFVNDFVLLFSGKLWICQHLPITITSNSDPDPDIAVVKIDSDRYPTPADIYLLVNVADSTLTHDRNQKAMVDAKV
jgi:hypothetical protein